MRGNKLNNYKNVKKGYNKAFIIYMKVRTKKQMSRK